MAKHKYTLTLDPEVVAAVRAKSPNLSAAVTDALKQLAENAQASMSVP